jgi:hypothetical protein
MLVVNIKFDSVPSSQVQSFEIEEKFIALMQSAAPIKRVTIRNRGFAADSIIATEIPY